MGLNTTLFLLNDLLGELKADTKLGELIHTAIQMGSHNQPIGHGLYVVETHHADTTAVVLVGGNTARVLMHLPIDDPKNDVKVAQELYRWEGIQQILRKERRLAEIKDIHGKKTEPNVLKLKNQAKKVEEYEYVPPPEPPKPATDVSEKLIHATAHLLSVEELNTLAKKKGFRLIALRRRGEKPKRLTTAKKAKK